MSKATTPRLKPITLRIGAIEHKQPNALSGNAHAIAACPLKAGDEATITPEHQEGGLFWASVFFKREGRPVGRLTLDGVPIAAFPFETAKPRGRPPETAKNKAVLLAWHICRAKNGLGIGEADECVRERFAYESIRKIREIRNEKTPVPGLTDDRIFVMNAEGDGAFAALIERPTYYLRNGLLEILGKAWIWHEKWRSQAIYSIAKFETQLGADTISESAIRERLGNSALVNGPLIIVGY